MLTAILSLVSGAARSVSPMIWVLVLALAWGGFQHHRAKAEAEALFRVKQEQLLREADAAKKAAEESARRLQAQQEVINVANAQVAAATADSAAAGALHVRLLAAAKRASQRPSCDAAPAGPGAPASAPAVVLADVLGRIDARAGELAAYADAARIAGLACERAYESLTPH